MKKNKWEICPECEGEGKVLCASMRGEAFSTDDFDNDPDFAEGYFGGRYDVQCEACEGTGKVLVTPKPEISCRVCGSENTDITTDDGVNYNCFCHTCECDTDVSDSFECDDEA